MLHFFFGLGIKRMEMELEYEMLDFMISAPSQGVVAISE